MSDPGKKRADLMLRAYSAATGASMASITRDCVVIELERHLRENAGIREKYQKELSRIVAEARPRVLQLVPPRERREGE